MDRHQKLNLLYWPLMSVSTKNKFSIIKKLMILYLAP
jgi:hypothetical protein